MSVEALLYYTKMPQFIFQKYIDKEFEDKQHYLSEISDRAPKIAIDSIKVAFLTFFLIFICNKSDEEFISLSVSQNKRYAQLIIDLFDYIENNKGQPSNNCNESNKYNNQIKASFSFIMV